MPLPFEITDAPEYVNEELRTWFPVEKGTYVQAGPEKYLLFPKYRDEASGIYNLELRQDDVWVVTFPRSGTMLTQELVWLINNDFDYERAKNVRLRERFPFIEVTTIMPDDFRENLIKLNGMGEKEADEFRAEGAEPLYNKISKMKSPRHIKTHIPFSLLPEKLVDTCKVLYVARNPKDVAVSYYHLDSHLEYIGYTGDFEKYWDLFQRNLVPWAPYWKHVEEGWKLREHPNVLFLFYEDMQKDMPSVLRKVAAFLNKSISEEQIVKLCEHLKIDNFKNSPSMTLINSRNLKGVTDDTKPAFIRQGKSGTWTKEFTQELNAKADKWINTHGKNTDLRFQYKI